MLVQRAGGGNVASSKKLRLRQQAAEEPLCCCQSGCLDRAVCCSTQTQGSVVGCTVS